jgi:hypothetical protein
MQTQIGGIPTFPGSDRPTGSSSFVHDVGYSESDVEDMSKKK